MEQKIEIQKMNTTPNNDIQAKRIRTAKDFYRFILIDNDWDKVKQCTATDCKAFESEDLPWGGIYTGVDELKKLIVENIFSHWSEVSIELLDITGGDNKIVGVMQLTGIAKATGKKVSTLILELLRFDENNLITECHPCYWNAKAIAEACNI